MIFDMKKKKLYRDLEDWVECVCPVEYCNECPISSYNNGEKCNCSEFVVLYPNSALELLRDRVKEVQSEAEVKKELEDEEMENMENMETMEENQRAIEENAPPLCRLLGVQPYQTFSYEGEDHWVFAIDENGVRYVLNRECGWRTSYDEENLVKFIQHPEKVVRKNETLELKNLVRMRKAQEKLIKILPGVKKIEVLNGKTYIQVKTMKGPLELLEINLETVEALEV